MKNTYTLYGSYASYYTAKTRAYLRKKSIPFVERLPSDPTFRKSVRPSSGSHRIPQLMAPDGCVLQDSVEIQDHLEARYPHLPAIPKTPRQRIFVHLMELMGSEGLLRLAWLHRWMFEENFAFVKKDFGRSFKPQGSDADLQKYGDLIADRMMSYGLPESSPAAREALDEKYKQLLSLFESHLIQYPYFLGGHPSAADYAVMGALHAHMGRDPAGLRVMQAHAPRVLRWVENMLLPEVQAPEFYNVSVEYLANDEVPDTALAVLHFIAEEYGKKFVLGAIGFNQAMEKLAPQAGYALAPEHDQPLLPAELVSYGVSSSSIEQTFMLFG
jgi:glutathione S-transferase